MNTSSPASIDAKRPHTLAIVQARLSSSRLPGKVLLPLDGRPMILFMLERVRRAQLIDEIVVATSTDESDNALVACLLEQGYAVHRGPLDDVLARFAGALAGRAAQVLIRLTGDCPLIDPAQIDRVVSKLLRHGLDYCSNGDPPSYPDGLDVEAFTAEALLAAHQQASLPSEREHVTPYLRAHPERFKIGSVRGAIDLSSLRWTVDHADDLALVQALVAALNDAGGASAAQQADLFDILRVLDASPELLDVNRHGRNEGYQKSLLMDAQILSAAT